MSLEIFIHNNTMYRQKIKDCFSIIKIYIYYFYFFIFLFKNSKKEKTSPTYLFIYYNYIIYYNYTTKHYKNIYKKFVIRKFVPFSFSYILPNFKFLLIIL